MRRRTVHQFQEAGTAVLQDLPAEREEWISNSQKFVQFLDLQEVLPCGGHNGAWNLELDLPVN